MALDPRGERPIVFALVPGEAGDHLIEWLYLDLGGSVDASRLALPVQDHAVDAGFGQRIAGALEVRDQRRGGPLRPGQDQSQQLVRECRRVAERERVVPLIRGDEAAAAELLPLIPT